MPDPKLSGPAPGFAYPAWFRRPHDLISALTQGLNMLGTLLILLLVVLINSDVFGRTVFGAPISGVPEMVSLSIVAIVFLQISQTVAVGRLTRSDALLNYVGRKWPVLRRAIEVVFNLAAAGLLMILFSASYPFLIKAWKKDTFIGSVGDFTAPVWPVKLIIVIGCGVLVLQFLLAALKAIKAPADDPETGDSHDGL